MEDQPRSAFRSVVAPIHPEGRIFVAGAILLTALVLWQWASLWWMGVVGVAFCAYFFRDPHRVTPQGDGLVISPADGRVIDIVSANPPPEMELELSEWTRISVFLSVVDVHVNRFPVDGVVRRIRYRNGKFVNAVLDKASEDNERNALHMTSVFGQDLVIVQIAGLVARRIVCDAREGQEVVAGERMGIIRFGSRVDIYLPAGSDLQVEKGQTMIGGETILAQLVAASAKPAKSPRR